MGLWGARAGENGGEKRERIEKGSNACLERLVSYAGRLQVLEEAESKGDSLRWIRRII